MKTTFLKKHRVKAICKTSKIKQARFQTQSQQRPSRVLRADQSSRLVLHHYRQHQAWLEGHLVGDCPDIYRCGRSLHLQGGRGLHQGNRRHKYQVNFRVAGKRLLPGSHGLQYQPGKDIQMGLTKEGYRIVWNNSGLA